MRVLLAACGGFLLGVLWMDLLFDVQVAGGASEAAVASIATYYARATTGAFPMNRLIAAVMLVAVLGSLVWLVRGRVDRRAAALALFLAALPIALAMVRVVPNAVRLGAREDPPAVQAELARSIYRDHRLCFASVLAFVLTVGLAPRRERRIALRG